MEGGGIGPTLDRMEGTPVGRRVFLGILGVGAVPFHLGAPDDAALLAEALGATAHPIPAG